MEILVYPPHVEKWPERLFERESRAAADPGMEKCQGLQHNVACCVDLRPLFQELGQNRARPVVLAVIPDKRREKP